MNSNTSIEEWKEIPGFDGVYLASTHGRIKSIDRVNGRGFNVRGKMLRPCVVGSGYHAVTMWKNCSSRRYYIHRLVAETFLGNPPVNHNHINHIDGNKTNNQLSNLEWVNRSENMLHAYKNDLTTHNRKVEIVHPSGRVEIVKSLKRTSIKFGYSASWVHDRMKRDGNPFYHEGHKITVIS